MSTTLSPPPIGIASSQTAPARTSPLTTPTVLLGAFGAIFLTTLIFWMIAWGSISHVRQTAQTIGKDAVPSIVASQQIRADLGDMDASSANAFLGEGDKVQAVKDQYEKDRVMATDQLITAAQNITYGDEERVPIVTMADKTQTYVSLVKVARSQGLPSGIKDLRLASALMHDTILPAADALDQANYHHLDEAYQASKSTVGAVQGGIFFGGALALAALIGTQVFLAQRTRRLLNAPLALATLLTVVFVIRMLGMVSEQTALMKRAKQDCFDSINALWKARAIAYDANADESLYLLESKDGEKYEQSFFQKSNQLVGGPLTDQMVAQAAANPGGSKTAGFLWDELRNITFPGEENAALDTLRGYKGYLDIDQQIRALERSGRHQDAVALCIGTAPGQSNYAFAQFDDALGRTLAINQSYFGRAVADAFSALRLMPAFVSIMAIIIVALSWLGLQPRIQEYRG